MGGLRGEAELEMLTDVDIGTALVKQVALLEATAAARLPRSPA
jgi:hypothetical protein